MFTFGNCVHVDSNPQKVVEWYTRGIEFSHAPSMIEMAHRYENGGCGLKQDLQKAIELYERAATLGDVDAMYYRAMVALNMRDCKEEENAWLRRAVDNGHGDACAYLSFNYQWEWGVEKDDKEALRLLQLGVQRHSAKAIFNWSKVYEYGELGVSQDKEHAFGLKLWASHLGCDDAMLEVGTLYVEEKKNYKEARQWLTRYTDHVRLLRANGHSAPSPLYERRAKKLLSTILVHEREDLSST